MGSGGSAAPTSLRDVPGPSTWLEGESLGRRIPSGQSIASVGHQQQEKLAAGAGIDEQINPSFGIVSLAIALHLPATDPALSHTFAFGFWEGDPSKMSSGALPTTDTLIKLMH